jgi:MFS transporter, DHA1 family, tetracycline resistance protein
MKSELTFDRIVPIFALVFVDVLGLTIILPLLHLYAAAYGGGPFEIGLVVAAFPLAQLVGVPVMGALSDRYGRKPLLLISQVSTCAGFILLGLSNSLTLIILARVIDGLFGANIATAQAALSDVTTDKNRAQGLGITGAAFGLGFIFGPVISLVALEFTDSLAIPAFIAAAYSFLSILLTLFMFHETLPPVRRAVKVREPFTTVTFRLFQKPQINVLLLLMFAQQAVFFGFESLLGLFTLSRLGLLGQGNAFVFIVVGVVLVMVQVRLIGRWSRKYGESRVVAAALALLAIGLILFALTPEQPHPFYVRQIVEKALQTQSASGTEALIGEIAVPLPENGHNGIVGLLWLLVVIVPISIGAGLIRPSLNSLMTRRVSREDFGGVLGLSSSVVSAANAVAPIAGGLLFQQYGSTLPFLLGGVVMAVLFLFSWLVVKSPSVSPLGVTE